MALNPSGRARVEVTEQDLSNRTPAGRGTYAGAVVPASRGPVYPILTTSPGNFLNRYTTRGKIEVGANLGMYVVKDTVRQTNKTWTIRAVSPSALIGGADFYRVGATNNNAAFAANRGYKDIDQFDPTTSDGMPLLANAAADFSDFANDNVTVTGALWATLRTGDAVTVGSGGVGATAPAPLVYGTTYYAIVTNTPNVIQLATSNGNALAGTPINLTNAGTVGQVMNSPTRSTLADADKRAFTIFAKDPGAWAQLAISVRVTMYTTDPQKVKEPGCFAIEVFNYNQLVETLIVSRDPAAVSLDGRSLYIEEVSQRSRYIDIIDNPTLTTSALPKEQLTLLSLGGGSDGLALTDADMIRALQVLESRANYPMSVISDSGWTTPAFQNRLETFAENRGDVTFFEGFPYSVEADSDYLNQMDTYASETLVSDSTYGGLFTPHKKDFDEDNNRYLFIPPQGYVAGLYAKAFDIYRPGEPVAGLEKGGVDSLDLLHRFDDGELDFLYDRNINPIRFKRGTGIHLWGQKTRQARPSAFDRLNIRTLLNGIKGPYADALEPYLFRLNQLDNDRGIRAEIKSVINARADTLVSLGSIYAYKTIIDSSNNSLTDVDNHILRIWHLIKPAISVEWIDFVIGVTSTAIDFEVAEAALR